MVENSRDQPGDSPYSAVRGIQLGEPPAANSTALVIPAGKSVADDHSRGFHRFRTQLVDSRGRRHVDFVRNLRPDYTRVYLDIALGYGCLAVSMAVCIWVSAHPVPKAAAVLVSAGLIGYWVAYLQLFIHEGAHFNLAHDRRRSDLICDALIAWMVGTSVRKYRKVHFQHHRALGTVDDSEFSYFFPLNLMFLAKSLFAVRTIDVL